MAQLWNHNRKVNPIIAAYTAGDDVLLDQTLLPYDIVGTKAHVRGLKRIGVLTAKEERSLLAKLTTLSTLATRGKVVIRPEDEDCHTVIENYLVKTCGSMGKKVQTGRSRNDQVLTALRLYMKDQLSALAHSTLKLGGEFLGKVSLHRTVPFPGYSHTQQAMPTSLGHYYASYVESLIDDTGFALSVLKHIDKSPLGSAAGFGSTLRLDRSGTAKDLGFSSVQVNTLYCQNSRGKFESAYLEAIEQIMMTLGKFASDMLLFTSREFAFFSVDETVTTGSSIMPQKKNLDGLELLRGYVAVISAHQHAVQNIAKGLPSGYNRDFQLIKKALMESSSIALHSVEVATIYLGHTHPNEETLVRKIAADILSADEATALAVKKGVPFRDAHELIAKRLASGAGTLTKKTLQQNVRTKISMGGPGNLRLTSYDKKMRALRKALASVRTAKALLL